MIPEDKESKRKIALLSGSFHCWC